MNNLHRLVAFPLFFLEYVWKHWIQVLKIIKQSTKIFRVITLQKKKKGSLNELTGIKTSIIKLCFFMLTSLPLCWFSRGQIHITETLLKQQSTQSRQASLWRNMNLLGLGTAWSGAWWWWNIQIVLLIFLLLAANYSFFEQTSDLSNSSEKPAVFWAYMSLFLVDCKWLKPGREETGDSLKGYYFCRSKHHYGRCCNQRAAAANCSDFCPLELGILLGRKQAVKSVQI
jgi:hypothetical protein